MVPPSPAPHPPLLTPHRLFQYYPFTSFFVLFSAIIRNPSAPSSSSVDYPLMRALVAYLSQMKAKNEGAAKLLSIASAFTHVAGTFLKNYLKIKTLPRGQQAKRRREEPAPLPPPPFRSTPYDAGAASSFWIHQQNTHSQVVAAAAAASAPTPPQDPIGDLPVDLQAASFLRWPGAETEVAVGGAGVGGGGEAAAGYDIDLEAVMAEPEGFQMQMEQAALRGPLEFDWFGWDGQFS